MTERASKKQRELLSFINGFIKGNGYGPSYREIMRALDYKSVSTVAVHVDGLISRGYLNKRDHSARSLEVTANPEQPHHSAPKTDGHIAWLKKQIASRDNNPESQATLRAALLILQNGD